MTADLSPLDTRLTERALTAAVRLFSAHGTESVNMYAIAFEADIDPIDFRRAFPTKLDLIYEITVRCTRALVEREISAAAPAASPLEEMCDLIRRHIEFSWEHRTEQELRRALLPTLRAIYPARYRELSALLRLYRDRVHDLIERGRGLGLFAQPHPSLAPVSAATILETLESILNWYDPAPDLNIEQLSDVYVDLVIHHLLGAPRD